jgi:hypothetical protein
MEENSAERAHLISELTGIALHDLRPDLLPRGDARMTGFVYSIECGDVGGRKS